MDNEQLAEYNAMLSCCCRSFAVLTKRNGAKPEQCSVKPRQKMIKIVLAPVVQTLDSAIHRINNYPADSVIVFRNTYPLDSDLSGG